MSQLGYVEVRKLVIEVPGDDYERADEQAALILTEILDADPRVKQLYIVKTEAPIWRD